MALEQLLAALEREAREAADGMLAAAREEAARLGADVEAELADRREAALGTLARDLEAGLQAELSAARLAGRSRMLGARDRLLSRVFEALDRQARTLLADPAWRAGLVSRLAAARACFDPEARLSCSAPPALVAEIRDSRSLPPGVAVESAPGMSPGFRLATEDGRVEVLDTLADRIATARPDLARHALGQLGFTP